MILHGDCINKIKELDDNSVDAIVTDPPYELGFMGKKWDASGIAYNVDLWKEALRVLKPGGHLLSFGGTRTYHRMACAIEDAGFEIRDMLEWIYASGFPKSQNVGKAFDKKMGNEREVVGERNVPDIRGDAFGTMNEKQGGSYNDLKIQDTKGNSEWEGWGTALKPAHEPIVLARKPLSEKTIVENCIKHGTGALDIDGCRIPTNSDTRRNAKGGDNGLQGSNTFKIRERKAEEQIKHEGRFPANLLVTDDALNDGEMTKSGYMSPELHKRVATNKNDVMGVCYGKYNNKDRPLNETYGDNGSKSRYFDIDVWGEKHGLIQTPKASKSERNAGCEGLEEKDCGRNTTRRCGNCGKPIIGLSQNDKCVCNNRTEVQTKKHNHHPTVKPLHLMSWLIRLVSQKGDTVLDPFMGSGTTGVACKQLDRNFIGIELNEEYIEIAEKRIACHKIKQRELF